MSQMHILPEAVENYVRGRFVAVLTDLEPPEAADRVMPGHRYREGRRSGGGSSDPTGNVVTEAEHDADRHAAWAAVVESALATLGPRAESVVRSMWRSGQPREFAAPMAGVSVPQVFVWEQQAIARAALQAAIDGLLT